MFNLFYKKKKGKSDVMLEELKMPIAELKENIMNVWGCL